MDYSHHFLGEHICYYYFDSSTCAHRDADVDADDETDAASDVEGAEADAVADHELGNTFASANSLGVRSILVSYPWSTDLAASFRLNGLDNRRIVVIVTMALLSFHE